MVYNGPSKGCRACRKRRVKCDQGKPACGNCSKRKVECPGYESTFDYRHRNETNSTILRATQKGDLLPRRKSYGSEQLTSEGEVADPIFVTDMAVIMANPGSAHKHAFEMPAPLERLPPDPETVVLCWYFAKFPMKTIDPQSTHGFTSLLKPIYLSSPSDSPLRPAVAAIASNLLMLFCHQGSDTGLARNFYAQSITRMKSMIPDPLRSKQDDLLLTTMTLHYYDNINMRWNPDVASFNNHRNGALALLKHRGEINTQSEVSRHITSCMRTAMCHWSLDSGMPISPELLEWVTEATVPTNKTCELDVLGLKLVDYQSRFNNMYDLYKGETLNLDQKILQELIEEGLSIDQLFLEWTKNCPQHWRPLYATPLDVLQTIREAGFYGERCAIYWDLSICDSWNTWRGRRIKLLQIIRQLYIDAIDSDVRSGKSTIEAAMHKMVDEQLETVPFMLGDLVEPLHHSLVYDIHYPVLSTGVGSYPNPDYDHNQSAAASAGWLCSSLLMSTAKLAVWNNHLEPFTLRRHQFDWTLEQLDRMQKVFLLSQPTHPKRWKAFKQF